MFKSYVSLPEDITWSLEKGVSGDVFWVLSQFHKESHWIGTIGTYHQDLSIFCCGWNALYQIPLRTGWNWLEILSRKTTFMDTFHLKLQSQTKHMVTSWIWRKIISDSKISSSHFYQTLTFCASWAVMLRHSPWDCRKPLAESRDTRSSPARASWRGCFARRAGRPRPFWISGGPPYSWRNRKSHGQQWRYVRYNVVKTTINHPLNHHR